MTETTANTENQKRIIEDNMLSTDICYDMIMNKRRTLWTRRNDQDDFLKIRVGTGTEPVKITRAFINYKGKNLLITKLISIIIFIHYISPIFLAYFLII